MFKNVTILVSTISYHRVTMNNKKKKKRKKVCKIGYEINKKNTWNIL